VRRRLGENKLGDAGVRHIASVVSENTTLHSLSLYSNQLTAAVALPVASMLRTSGLLLLRYVYLERSVHTIAAH
jgi:hypothetical protein